MSSSIPLIPGLSRGTAWRLAESISFSARVTGAYYLVAGVELEYGFHRLVVHTAGTKVMHWLSVPARFFYAKGIGSGIVLYQVVALTLANAFFELSHSVAQVVIASQQRAFALGGLKAILLHDEHLSPQLYQLSSEFIGGRRDLRFVQRLYSSLVNTNRLADARDQTQNVHKNPPVVDESRVSASDSTARGDIGVTHTPERDEKVPVGPTDV